MPTSLYNFQYVPLTGRLPGKSFVSQTEQAINGLAQYVYDNSTNYEAVKSIAQKAEEDSSSALEYSEQALDKAQTALETVGRAYIKTTSAVDLNDYFDSELLLILSTASTNLPASISGYLTVMSSDTHDYCMQVYIGIDGSVYKRTAIISNNTPTFGAWSETPITLSSLQTILADYAKVDASNIGANAQTDNSVAWGNAIGGGEIAEDEQRLITGGTVYPLSQNVEQNTSNIATNTADIVQNTGGVSANSKRIGNIEKLLQGNLYDYDTDDDTAYTKSVPSGAMPYAGLEKVGGKTLVWNQINKNEFMSQTVADVVFTNNNDGSWTANGTATADSAKVFSSEITMINGHKYFMRCYPDISGCSIDISGVGAGTGSVKIINWSFSTGNTYILNFRFANGTVFNNLKIYSWIIDLTLMFGAGNEPSTVAEFESMFPADYYAYNEGTLLSAGVTEVESVGKNLVCISSVTNGANGITTTYNSETQEIHMQGTSTGNGDTFITLSKNIKLKKGEKITVSLQGSGTISGSTTVFLKNDDLYFTYANIALVSTGVWAITFTMTENQEIKEILYRVNSGSSVNITVHFQAEKGETATPYSIPFSTTYPISASIQALEGYGWSCPDHYNYIDYEAKKYVQEVGSRAYASGDESDSTVITDGATTYYPLITAVETDISEYITDDNLIEVEAGGTLTFPNSNGDDYRLQVPSEEEYMIDLQSAIGG